MKLFLNRFLRISAWSRSTTTTHCRSDREDTTLHKGFKTRPGQGPFLQSFDGRVIPLRKARFLPRR